MRDLGFDYDQPSARGYQTAERLPYHCDSGDVVGLLSIRTAKAAACRAPFPRPRSITPSSIAGPTWRRC